VKTSAQLEAELADAVADGAGTANRPCRAVKAGKEAVAGSVNFFAPEAAELPPNRCVMGQQQLTPGTIAKLRSLCSRSDDIREQDRGEHSIWFSFIAIPRLERFLQELLELAEEPILIPERRPEISAGKFNQACIWDSLRHVPTAANVESRKLRPVHDERRYMDQRQHVPYVQVEVHENEVSSRARADAETPDTH
jgi:hypothetical protein